MNIIFNSLEKTTFDKVKVGQVFLFKYDDNIRSLMRTKDLLNEYGEVEYNAVDLGDGTFDIFTKDAVVIPKKADLTISY